MYQQFLHLTAMASSVSTSFPLSLTKISMGVVLSMLWVFSLGPFFCVCSMMLVKPSYSFMFLDVFTRVTCGPCPVLEAFPGWWRRVLFSMSHGITSRDPLWTATTPALPSSWPWAPHVFHSSLFTYSASGPQTLPPGETLPCPSPFLIHNIPRKVWVASFISACLLSGETDTKQRCFLSQLHCLKAMGLRCTSVPRI